LNHSANISGYVKLLSDKKYPSADAEEVIKSIGVLSQKITGLLSRLMRFAQKPSLKLEPVSIHGVIEDALDLTYPLVRYSKMAVEKRFDPGVPLVMGERGRLQEVFVTLILNALEVMPGKGTLTITTAPAGEIDGIRIVVSDSGIGITPENVSRIRTGESFFTAKQPEGKLGLGLLTAYEIVNKHKGKIDLESTIGKGTTFVIQLPAAQKEAGL
jgi:signal transduction histidine kinase